VASDVSCPVKLPLSVAHQLFRALIISDLDNLSLILCDFVLVEVLKNIVSLKSVPAIFEQFLQFYAKDRF